MILTQQRKPLLQLATQIQQQQTLAKLLPATLLGVLSQASKVTAIAMMKTTPHPVIMMVVTVVAVSRQSTVRNVIAWIPTILMSAKIAQRKVSARN